MAHRSGRLNAGPSGTISTSIRSGRFQATLAVGDRKQIAQGVAGEAYRVFNTGKKAFEVHASDISPVPLQMGASADLTVGAGGAIEIVNAHTEQITLEGIYDKLDNVGNPVRNGRFTGDATDDVRIIQGRGGFLYRIFNSSKAKPFKVNGDESPLWPRCSRDIAVTDSVDIIHAFEQATNAELIYDFLDVQNPIRSGRFRLKRYPSQGTPIVINPAHPYKIIDLAGEEENAYYRFFNSGENPVTLGTQDDPNLLQIDEGQSYDCEVPANSVITVKSSGANKAIEGVYDFLGAASSPTLVRSSQRQISRR